MQPLQLCVTFHQPPYCSTITTLRALLIQPAAIRVSTTTSAIAVHDPLTILPVTPGVIAGVAAAADAAEPQGHPAAPHPTPVLTPAEADALRRRALDLAARLKAAGVPGEMLAWLEARALLPLASAAVWRVAAASARAAPGRTAVEGQQGQGQGQGQGEREALTQQAAELLGLLVKALAGCGVVGLEDKVAAASYARSALADAVRGWVPSGAG